jgi:hypothetical protein
MENYRPKTIAIQRLNSLLSWSDRIGSDEIHEIRTIIKLLKIGDYEKIEEEINTSIDQLGQALSNADWHYNGVIEKDRIQDAMRTLMSISQTYNNLKKKRDA